TAIRRRNGSTPDRSTTVGRFFIARLCLVLIVLTPWPSVSLAQSAAGSDAWLIVPFELTSPTARTYWLGEGVAGLLGDELEHLGLRTLGRDARAAALDQLRLPTSVTLTRATNIRVGELLGARMLVFGTVTTDESAVTLTVRRLQMESGQLEPEIVEKGT